MKSVKKILSLVLSLVMIIGVMVAIPTTTVSAAAGDVWTLNHTQSSWHYYTSSYVTHNSATEFIVNGNKGSQIGNTGVLLSNNISNADGAVKSNTTYKIKFNLGVANSETLDKLFVAIGLGSSTWGTRKVSYDGSKGELASIATQVEWTQWAKWDIEIIYTTGTISGTQYFILDATMAGATAKTYLKNISVTELGTYNVCDENGNILDTVYGVPGDDTLTLVNLSAANKQGLEIEAVSPTTIAADTTQIIVTYKESEIVEEPKVITFDETYLQNKPNSWTYYAEDDNGLLAIKNNTMSLKNTSVVPNVGTSFGNRAFLAANKYNEYLTPGGAYEVILKISTFTQYTPLNSLSAEIKFGTGIWNVTSNAASFNGAQLEKMISNTPTASASGSVTFEIKTYIKVPETGNNNLIISVYGGEFYIPEVIITPASEVSVTDDTGTYIGNVVCMVGDKTADIIPDSFKTDADCDYTTEPEIIEDVLTPIVLTKTLKSNLTEKIDFSGDDYKGYSDTTGHYYNLNNGSESQYFYKDSTIKGISIHRGQSFGDRAILLSNDRIDTNVTPGEKYRVKFQLRTTATELSNYRIDLAFTDTSVWNANVSYSFSGAEIEPLIKSVTTGNTYKYVIAVDVIVPETESIKNVCISVSGINDPITYWIDYAYIVKETTAEILSYNEEYFATINGYEGDEICEAISVDGTVKFVGITDVFGSEKVKVKSNSLVYRGDANEDGEVNADDVLSITTFVLDRLFSDAYEYDNFAEFGYNANNDDEIDLRDVVRTKKIFLGYYDGDILPTTLQYSDYALAWNYEFDGTSVDENVINSISGVHEVEGINYVTVGDKNCVNVADGILNISPKYNYGHMLASNHFSTQNTMNFAYGYFEIRAKLPYSAANLPAVWFKTDGVLNNTGNGDILEYDLLETFGSTTNFRHNVHYWDANGNTHNANNVDGRTYSFESNAQAAQYHTYGFEWYYDESDECSYITLYVDGVKQGTLSANDINHSWYQDVPEDFDRPMYMILSNQIITQAYADANSDWIAGRGATAEDFPMDMCVDYIRLYQSESNTGNVLVTK